MAGRATFLTDALWPQYFHPHDMLRDLLSPTMYLVQFWQTTFLNGCLKDKYADHSLHSGKLANSAWNFSAFNHTWEGKVWNMAALPLRTYAGKKATTGHLSPHNASRAQSTPARYHFRALNINFLCNVASKCKTTSLFHVSPKQIAICSNIRRKTGMLDCCRRCWPQDWSPLLLSGISEPYTSYPWIKPDTELAQSYERKST